MLLSDLLKVIKFQGNLKNHSPRAAALWEEGAK